jgi:hypothetical protein
MMRTKKTVVILISGKAGSGKGTVAQILDDKLKALDMDTMMYGFADPLKYIAKAFFGWNGEKDEKGRKLLQQIGAVGRQYDENIWVTHFLNQLDKRAGIFPKHFALISDWRFPNELNYLKSNPLLDIVTIRVFGRGGLEGENSLDSSENSLPEVSEESLQKETLQPYYDFTVDNGIDIEVLKMKLDLVLGQLQKQYIIE